MDALTPPGLLAGLALEIGREAGRMLVAGAGDVRAVGTKSSQHDLVTQMDRASEELIRKGLSEVRPGDVVLGEEGGSDGDPIGPDAVRWIVDPVDGTVNYFYGMPSWAVSIAAERAGVVVAGVVVAPALGEEFVAHLGGGATMRRTGMQQAQPLRLTGSPDLADAVVATGFGYRRERREHQGRVIAELLPRVRDIRRGGAAAIDLCWVAAGRVDAYYERGPQIWDRAAGALIARESGALVGGLRGEPEGESMTVAAGAAVFGQLVAALAELGATDGP